MLLNKKYDLVITGASGFIGRELCKAFSLKKNILALSRNKLTQNTINNCDYLNFDLSIDTNKVFKQEINLESATLIHSAAIMNGTSVTEFWQSNICASYNVFKWAVNNNVKNIIFFSTGGVYPYRNQYKHKETCITQPIGFYGHSKLICEQILKSFVEEYSISATSLRLYFPYGPEQKKGIFPLISNAINNAKPLIIKNNGKPVITPIHVSDVVSSVALLLEKAQAKGHIAFNLCGDECISFLDLVKKFEDIYKKNAVLKYINEEAADLMGDNSLIKNNLQWKPKYKLDSLYSIY